MATAVGSSKRGKKRSRKTLDPYAEYLSIGASRRVFDGAIYVLAGIRPTRNGADHAAEQWRKQGRYARVTSTGSQRFTAYRGKPAFAVWVR